MQEIMQFKKFPGNQGGLIYKYLLHVIAQVPLGMRAHLDAEVRRIKSTHSLANTNSERRAELIKVFSGT